MTREEAITILECTMPSSSIYCGASDEEIEEAMMMAINALDREQQFLEAGYKNGRVEFNIGGRKFMVKEMAQ